MKVYVFAVAVIVTGVAAMPEIEDRFSERFLVESIIKNMIEDMKKDLVEKGMDPMKIEGSSHDIKPPVTDILWLRALIGDVVVEGISNILIERVSYSTLLSRLQLKLLLPLVKTKVEPTDAAGKLFKLLVSGHVSGSLGVEGILIDVEVRVSIGIISGITVRSLRVDFSIKGIESEITFIVNGRDHSDEINTLLVQTVPATLKEYSKDINEILEYILRQILEEAL